MPNKALVVDANILVRAALGTRVREVIETYAGEVSFFVPESAYAEAEEHVAALITKRGGNPEKALALLRSLSHLVELIGTEVYGEFEVEARERLAQRDPKTGPVGFCTRSSVPNLDRRHRFLRLRSSHVDIRPRPDVSSGVKNWLMVAVAYERAFVSGTTWHLTVAAGSATNRIW